MHDAEHRPGDPAARRPEFLPPSRSLRSLGAPVSHAWVPQRVDPEPTCGSVPAVKLLVLAMGIFVIAACSDDGSSATAPPSTRSPEGISPSDTPAWNLGRTPTGDAATEVRVLDGDSLEASIDGAVVEVRLLGINAPERSECWDGEAAAALVEAVGVEPVLIDGVGGKDRFGRTLAYLWNGNGLLVNLELVAEGHALSLTGDHPEAGAFLAAEGAAYEAGVGLWGSAACGPPAPATMVLDEIVSDPPGRDYGNEYVRLRNDGSDSLDLSGWTIRDETSSHRFVFPAGTTVAPGGTVTLRSGCGDDGPGSFWWQCRGDPVWSNDGDLVLLLDRRGNVVLRHRYP